MSNFAIGLIEDYTVLNSSIAAAAGTSNTYIENKEPGLVYRSTTTGTALSFELDLGAAMNIGMMGIFGLPTALSAPTVRWRGATSQANLTAAPTYDSGVVNLYLSSSRTAALAKSLVINTNRPSLRYWRCDLACGVAATWEIARVALCDLLQPVANVEWGFKFEVEDTSKLEMSETGFDDVVEQRILPKLSGTIPWGAVAEEPRMRQLVYRAGSSKETVACLDPADTTWGEDKTVWGRFSTGLALTLADYDMNQLDFSVRAIQP